MARHLWGEEGFDWAGLYEAQLMLYREMSGYGVYPTQLKEKFGTLRCYMGLPGLRTLHDILWPGHMFNRWPCTCGAGLGTMHKPASHRRWCVRSFMWWADIYMWPHVFRWTGLTWLTTRIHRTAHRRAYERTVQAYPHLRDEILSDAEWGSCMHMHDWNDYWTSSASRFPAPNPTWVEHLSQLRGD